MPKIKGKEHLVKDEYTQAVINTDRDAYTLYKKRKTIIKAKNGEIEKLKLEMSELKVMMAEVLEKCNGEECK